MKVPKKLALEWEAKLKASGFDDIEHMPNTPYLKNHSRIYARSGQSRQFKERYYALASQFVNDETEFSRLSPFDRWLWERHAEGKETKESYRLHSSEAPKEGNPHSANPDTVSYCFFKRRLRRLRKVFFAWAKREAWLDEVDEDFADVGGIDTYLASVVARQGKGEPPS